MTKIVFEDGKRVDFNPNHGAGGLFASKGGGSVRGASKGGSSAEVRTQGYNNARVQYEESLSPHQRTRIMTEAINSVPRTSVNPKIEAEYKAKPPRSIRAQMFLDMKLIMEHAIDGDSEAVAKYEGFVAAGHKALKSKGTTYAP